jgi:endonuclease/exonuclease/phosphatase family metal-dependent hydrolase
MRASWWALIITVIAVAFLIILVLFRVTRRSTKNYTDPSGPFYEGHYAEKQPEFNGSLKVVTWNIHFSKMIDEAIQTLQEAEDLQDADILLLQEMNAEGVEAIAQILHYDYVYYPASIHRRNKMDFGNAILSKWPIIHSSKIVLPNTVPMINQTRIAVKAVINIFGTDVNVYSTHLETVWMVQRSGNTQVDFLVEQISQDEGYSILGGDFNTWNRGSIVYLEQQLSQIDMKRVSAGTGYTFEYAGLKLTLDHIFSSEVSNFEAGVWRQTKASDHYPVWAEIYIE